MRPSLTTPLLVSLCLGLTACASGPKRPGAAKTGARDTLQRCEQARDRGETASAYCAGLLGDDTTTTRTAPTRLPSVNLPTLPPMGGGVGGVGGGIIR